MGEVSVVVGHDHRSEVAYELLCAEVARLVGAASTDVVVGHRCPRCGGADHGRPCVTVTTVPGPAPHVSLGRARGLTVVAVSDAPVGVDVEPVDAASFDGFDDVTLHPDERVGDDRDRTRLWVRKEALLKATGDGLRTDPRVVRVDTDRVTVAGGPSAWVQDLAAPGYVIGVAVLATTAPRLTVRAVAAPPSPTATP